MDEWTEIVSYLPSLPQLLADIDEELPLASTPSRLFEPVNRPRASCNACRYSRLCSYLVVRAGLETLCEPVCNPAPSEGALLCTDCGTAVSRGSSQRCASCAAAARWDDPEYRKKATEGLKKARAVNRHGWQGGMEF